MRAIQCTVLCCLLIPSISSGQEQAAGRISGFVREYGTDRPLPDAHVILKGHPEGSVTDETGFFELRNLRPGKYVLSVSYIGYKKETQRINLSEEAGEQILIKLSPLAFTGREVVISAETEEHPTGKPLRIKVIPLKKIEAAPVQNIPALLDYISGVNMENTFGIFSSRAIVTLRGLPANDQSRTLILLDGIPVNKTDQGSVNWNMINRHNIAGIRVIKGPGPARYGSGAMGGVIEITGKKPSKRIGASVSAEYGTYNTGALNLHIAGRMPDSSGMSGFYWNMNAFGRKSDGYLTEPDAFIEPEDTILVPTFLEELNTTLKAGYDLSRDHNVEINLGYFDDRRGNGVQVFEDYGAFSEHDTYSGYAKYSGRKGPLEWKLDLFLIYENYKRTYEYMKEGEYQLYGVDADRIDKGTMIELSFNGFRQHRITGGFSTKTGSVDATDTYYTSTDIIRNAGNMSVNALYIQDDADFFNDKMNLSIGLRYDFARYYGGLFTIDYPSYSIGFIDEFEERSMDEEQWDAFCPRVSLQYRFTNENRIYVSAARGFRGPILDDMTRTGKRKGTFKVANPELGPELIDAFEVGGDIMMTANLYLGASIYYSIGRDFMYYTSTGDSVNMGYKIVPILKKQNISRVDIHGFETEAKYDLNNSLTFFANYTYSQGKIKKHNVTGAAEEFDLKGKFLTDIPLHKVSGGIYWMNRFADLTLLYKFTGERWINDLNAVDNEYLLTDRYPAYSVFSVRAKKELNRHIEFSLSVENIFNSIYTDSKAQKNPGRFIMGGLKITI